MKRVAWLVLVVVALVGCNALGQPSAEEIVRRAEVAMENVETARAIIELEVTTEGESYRVVGEGWMRDEQARATVLEASQPELVGSLAVSDGATGWLYHPDAGVALTGSLEEMKAYRDEQGELPSEMDFNSLTEAVDELLRITDETLVGSETIAGLDAWHLQLTPNTEAPPQLSAIGGVVDLWVSKSNDLPLQLTYTGSTMGEGRVTVRELDTAPDFDEAFFSFTPPTGVEIVDVATLLPEKMTLAEARESASFTLLSTPSDSAESALVSVFRLQDAFVQEFDGTLGSWTLTQSAAMPEHHSDHRAMTDTVDVRGTQGWLHSDEERGGTMLAWEEDGAFVMISGSLSPETALTIAEGLE